MGESVASVKIPVVKVPSPRKHAAAIQTVLVGIRLESQHLFFGNPSCEILDKTSHPSVTRVSCPSKQESKHLKFRVG